MLEQGGDASEEHLTETVGATSVDIEVNNPAEGYSLIGAISGRISNLTSREIRFGNARPITRDQRRELAFLRKVANSVLSGISEVRDDFPVGLIIQMGLAEQLTDAQLEAELTGSGTTGGQTTFTAAAAQYLLDKRKQS